MTKKQIYYQIILQKIHKLYNNNSISFNILTKINIVFQDYKILEILATCNF